MSHEPNPSPAQVPNWLTGGGELAPLIAALDWSETPLGPPECWPQSLRTTISLCLASNFPINIIWGPSHTQIYNSGFRVICADKHPAALGMDFPECWASAWPVIGPPFERALQGDVSFLENQRMFLFRNGYFEETFFTFSFSPIRDESGGIAGLFAPVTETTATMIGERRSRVIRDLTASLGYANSTAEVFRTTIATLSGFDLDLPFVLLYSLDKESRAYHLSGATGVAAGSAISPVLLHPDGSTIWPMMRLSNQTDPLTEISGLQAQIGPIPCGPYDEAPDLAFCLPIRQPGIDTPVALLMLGASARLPMSDGYRSLYDLIAATFNAALTRVTESEKERKRLDALAALDRAKTAFFSNVSHEFRTPLTLLLGPLEEVLRTTSVPDEAKQALETAHRNSLRLLKLVNTLLDFSRIESGRVQASYGPIDLATATIELASVFRSAIEKAGLALDVDCEQLPAPVYVDPDMWEKIVLNLLSNAFKFTFEGTITISLRWQTEHVELRVRDTGVGIPVGELTSVFDRFHRVRGTRARTHEGSGIGLALVQELARLHGGDVHVDSTEGVGTTFTVRVKTGTVHLPLDRITADPALQSTRLGAAPFIDEAMRWLPEETPLGARSPEELGTPSVTNPTGAPRDEADASGRPRIVWVDDNADMRDYVGRLLTSSFQVEAIADGAAALAAIRRAPPDLILADVMMPALGGFELLRAIRADPSTATVPVVLLSARAGHESRVEGMEAGADDYLIKPFSARELVARVDAHVKLGRVRRELAALRQRESEEHYRRLFDLTDEGFCVIEVLFDGDGPVDYRFLETNASFERLTGLHDATGRRMRDLAPGHEQYWFDIYGQIARTGEPQRFEQHAVALGHWYDVYAFRVGQPEQRRVAILFNESTSRKRREANASLLERIGQDLAHLSIADEVLKAVGAQVGEFMHLSGCAFVDVDETPGESIVQHAWRADDAPRDNQAFSMKDDLVAETWADAGRAGEAIIVHDTQCDPRVNAEHWRCLSIGSWVTVPFQWQGQWTGYVAVWSEAPREWSEEEVALLREIANRVFTRVERARAEEALRVNEQRARIQKEAFQSAINGEPLPASLKTLTRIVTEQLGGDVRTAFYLAYPDGASLHAIDGAGDMPDTYTAPLDGFRIGKESFCSGYAIATGRPALTRNVFEDPLWQPYLHLASAHAFQATGSYPILTRDGKAIGTFSMYFADVHDATSQDFAVADAVTQAAAIILSRHTEALERGRAETALRESEERLRGLNEELEDRVRARTAEIKALFKRLVSAQEDERRRIARDIHDQLGQQMTALRMRLEMLGTSSHQEASSTDVQRAQRLAEELDQSIDFLTWQLRPAALDHLGLRAALSHLVTGWSERFGINAEYDTIGIDGERFSPDIEANLYRVTQEALHNIVKHAKPTHVSVLLERRNGRLALAVEDNGVGFSVVDRHDFDAGSMGLINMRERALLVGGELIIDSAPGHGTTVIVRMPAEAAQ